MFYYGVLNTLIQFYYICYFYYCFYFTFGNSFIPHKLLTNYNILLVIIYYLHELSFFSTVFFFEHQLLHFKFFNHNMYFIML